MREFAGDMWRLRGDAYVITTNFSMRKDGHAVMGRGCALEAKEKWPDVSLLLGALLRTNEHRVHVLRIIRKDRYLISYPVKFFFSERADLDLITVSAEQLRNLAQDLGLKNIVMPRPGCGNGGLRWEEVKLEIGGFLDERFIVCRYENEV
jgi:hypothetical protein